MSKLQLPVRVMRRISAPHTKHLYGVFEQQNDGTWLACSPTRPHSTTAFADLGRLVNKEVQAYLEAEGGKL